MPVVELLVSAFLPVLLERLASPELLQFLRQEGLYSKIKTWEKTLKLIQAVLGDAETKQLENEAVKKWLDDLQDLAYDVEDILDEFATDDLARKLKMEQRDQPSTNKVRKLVPPCFRNISPRAIKFNTRMRSEIKDVKCRLEQLCKLKDGLGLMNIAGGTSDPAHRRQPTTSIAIEPAVYGRKEDKARILEMVFRDEPSLSNFHVISIVGMGGIGKSTLARDVYNDKEVESFELKAWVCASNDFDVLRISKAILENICNQPCNINDLNAVQNQLQQKVAGKKFLLVLDDVWSKDNSSWETLRSPFKVGASGSKIIVTTRHEDVALRMRSSSRLHRLSFLSDDDCWSLFKAHAFDDEDNSTHPDIQSIRQKVVEKSKGLPLASRILGGLLYEKKIDEWLKILNSKMWDFEDQSEIPLTLKVSYFYLPSHLKRCFAYCAILLEDYEFHEEELILLWMAEGLIQPSEEMEDFGHEYFNDLLSRSFFQRSNNGKSKYIMHDLIRDLARWASGGTCFHLEDTSGALKQLESFKKVRHLSYGKEYCDGKCKFEVISEVEINQHLRTFLALATKKQASYISPTIISDLLPKFKKLRMLSLEDYHITELPESIGDLRHLRHLNLSGTRIKSLPKSTSSLINLLILQLKGCYCLKKLPSKISNLIKLRYLNIRGVDLEKMPLRMNKLKCLRYLSDFIVVKGVGAGLKDLKNIENLCGELWISRLENVDDLHEISAMILNDKKEIKELKLKLNSKFDDTRNEVKEKKVLDMLRPHQNLKRLEIIFYGGTEFPFWVGDSSFSKLTVLTLKSCKSCTLLPSLGLLRSLKDLTIKGMNGLKKIDKEFCGQHCLTPFESLETLCFEYLQEWEYWEPIQENGYDGAFSRLRKFSIINCPKLCGSLPTCLPSLEEFVIKNCNQLVVSFSSLPMLCNLDIDGCREVACVSPVDFKLLESISLSNISEFGNWSRHDYFQRLEYLKIRFVSSKQFTNFWQPIETFLQRTRLGVQSYFSITNLRITHCPDLVSFPEVCFFSNLENLEMEYCSSLRFIVNGQLPPTLKRLKINGCNQLEYLWDDRELSCTSVVGKDNSSSNTKAYLQHVPVYECSSLKRLSLTGEIPPIFSIHFVQELESIPESIDDNSSLEEIHIISCGKLKNITKSLHKLTRLQKLAIYFCGSIMNLAEDGLSKDNLSELEILYCEELKDLPKGFHSLNSLKSLRLYRCPSMRSFPEEGFPKNLTSLEIRGDLEIYQPLLEWGLDNLTSLRSLKIWGRPEAKSFPEQEMGIKLPYSLTHLKICEFPNFNWILSQGFRNLNSLKELEIYYCQGQASFPKLALPSSLQSLWIKNCPGLTSISELGQPSSLECLYIRDCPSLTSISELVLTSSLKSLSISWCSGLTSIPELGQPSSLECLYIRDCPGLTSISELCLPSSLLKLIITSCSNVSSLPEQGLPSSLLELHISGCPMLKKGCKRDKGKEWSKISHIPHAWINGIFIYDIDEEE